MKKKHFQKLQMIYGLMLPTAGQSAQGFCPLLMPWSEPQQNLLSPEVRNGPAKKK